MKTQTDQENTTFLNGTRMGQHLISQESSSLTHVRGLIGKLHRSGTSIRIEDFPIVEATPRGHCGYSFLAREILSNTIKEAAMLFTHTNGKVGTRDHRDLKKKATEAFAFMSGTGFDVMIQTYELGYDSKTLKTLFYERFHIESS